MKIKPYLLNWIYNNAKKGAKPPNLEEKSVTITENGTTNVAPDSGYDGLSGVTITTNVSGGADLNEYFTGEVAKGNSSTSGFAKTIKKIPENTTVSGTSLSRAFTYCSGLIEISLIDTSNVTNIDYMCQWCSNLTIIPQFNISNVTTMNKAFEGCNSLNNDSLNNIMAMCINATSYTGTKTLTYIGLSTSQIYTCKKLSNWNDFVNAGWSA